MTEVLSFATRDMETVRASLHPHINLQKPFRNSRGFTLSSDGRQSPSPFRSGSGRKRASTINTADANHGMFEPLNVGASSQDGPRDIICLCTPAPKIPRPRNGE
ncbi:slightly ste11-like protein [Metarhizium acridum]|nr:slightly ste11-like protein [Metarhizium acridum]